MTAYLFDLDGTLADTLPLIIQSSRLALTEFQRETTDEEIIALIGVPLLETGEILLGEGMGEIYRECYHRHFSSLDSSGLRAFPGMAELLAELSAAGGKLACVTSKRRIPAEQTLTQTGLRAFFSALICAESCEKHKPHAEPALIALRLLQATEEKAIFIGDSVFDIGCAVNAGIISCGVTWGAEQEQRLIQAGADHIAHDTGELRAILLGVRE